MKTKKTFYNRIVFKMLPILLLALTTLVTTTGCGKTDGNTKVVLTTGFEKNQVFKINDEVCTMPEIMVYLTNMQNQYVQVFGEEICEAKYGEMSFEGSIKDNAISKIAQVKSIVLLARERGTELDEEDLELVKQATDQYWNSLNSVEIEKMGVTRETIEGMYTEYALAEKVYSDMIKDVNPEISDDEARTITVAQIFLRASAYNDDGELVPLTGEARKKVKRNAENVLKRAQEGEDFNKLAIECSDSDEITISFGEGEVSPEMETAGFKLGKDEISNVIETEEGYVIMKCISTFDREQTDENKVKIVERRKKEAFSREYEEFIGTLTKALNEELWNEVELIKDDNVATSDFFEIFETLNAEKK